MTKLNDEYRLQGESEKDAALRHEFEQARRTDAEKVRQEMLRKDELERQSQLAKNSAMQSQFNRTASFENPYSQMPVQQLGPVQSLNPYRLPSSQMLAEHTAHGSPFSPMTELQYPRIMAEPMGASNAFTPTGGIQYPQMMAGQIGHTSSSTLGSRLQNVRRMAGQLNSTSASNPAGRLPYSLMSAQDVNADPPFRSLHGRDRRMPNRVAPDYTPRNPNPDTGNQYRYPPGPYSAQQTEMAWSNDPAYIAMRDSKGWSQGPPFIDPEWYDEKNHHRFDGDLFIPKSLFDNVPVSAVPVPIATIPTAPIPTPEAAPQAMAPAARKDSYEGKYAVIYWWSKAHAPASDWKFNKWSSYIPRKDMNWRELFHEMTGEPIEDMDDQWVSTQSHWIKASASTEALMRGGWPTTRR